MNYTKKERDWIKWHNHLLTPDVQEVLKKLCDDLDDLEKQLAFSERTKGGCSRALAKAITEHRILRESIQAALDADPIGEMEKADEERDSSSNA